jgi:dipeptidase E
VKLLLTSAGIKNPSIHAALLQLLGRPIDECDALCIATATYCMPNGAELAYNFISGQEPRCPMTELGWKSLGVLELPALLEVDKAIWVPKIQDADVILVNGGDTLFLAHWMRVSGFADLLPTLNGVYVGLSAGSVVMEHHIGERFVNWRPPEGGDVALGVVDLAIFPHLNDDELPRHSLADAEKWAADLTVPSYAIDDETAIKWVDGEIEVISEGTWKLFNAPA